MTLSHEHMLWAYRLFLDREPENEAVLENNFTFTQELRAQIMQSPEFLANNTSIRIEQWVIKETKYGFRIYLSLAETGVSLPILLDTYDEKEFSLLPDFIQPGDVVFDIGANIGFYSMRMAQLVGPTGHVVSFEPIGYLREALSKSCKENAFDGCIDINSCALADTPGEMLMRHALNTTNFGGAHLTSNIADDGHSYDRIEVRTLNEFDQIDGRCTFIKLDVEGAEPRVIAGGTGFLNKHKPVILSELHNGQLRLVSDQSATGFIMLLHTLGYSCRSIDGNQELTSYDRPETINVVFHPN